MTLADGTGIGVVMLIAGIRCQSLGGLSGQHGFVHVVRVMVTSSERMQRLA